MTAAATSIAFAVLGLAGCSPSTEGQTVTIASHDSFVFSKEMAAEFRSQTGIRVKVLKQGDAGALTNKLVLTKGNPIADAVFGIDNTFASVATDAGAIDGSLSAIDFGDVCFNYDKRWFVDNSVAAPTSWLQLTDATYRGLTVVQNPSTSSTGLAFLAATVANLGEGSWQRWWSALKANDVTVTAGWEDAYYTQFSGTADAIGTKPIVLSYSSSPAYEVRENGQSATASILDGCFRQIEYAGVLSNAKHKDAAAKLIDFLKSETFQKQIPDTMYVYPIDTKVELPEAWAKWAPAATKVANDSQLNFATDRANWLSDWDAIFG